MEFKENILILLFIILSLIELMLLGDIQSACFPSRPMVTIAIMPWVIVANSVIFEKVFLIKR